MLSLACALALAGCRHEEPAAQATALPVLENARLESAALRAVPVVVEAVGTVAARRRSVLSARVTAHVTAVLVREGDRVRAGQVLALLDDRDARATLAASEASLAAAHAGLAESRASLRAAGRATAVAIAQASLADASFRRQQALRERRTNTPQEYDEAASRRTAAAAETERAAAAAAAAAARETQAVSAIAEAEARLAAARANLAFCRILAPFDGVVAARAADPGVLASPGAALLTIEEERYWLEAAVPASAIASASPGRLVTVSVDALSFTTRAPIAEIVPAAESAAHTFLARVPLDAAHGVRSGLYGTLLLEAGSRPALLVPAAALTRRGQLERLFVAGPDGVARMRLVRVGRLLGPDLEILSGLGAGETVVTSGADRALDPCRVEATR
ncbi:MAG: efflux RND transporter periplasmic adaptor subunit [Candidatus Wallbacteria bacterium]|nr:efflux RND transporter periplasmic adaptor subunit [Candidatus Wallbacteria bacterium]